jgi:hypothetical protein
MRIQSTLTAFHFAGFLLLLGFARPVFASSDIALADILDANGRIYNPNQLSGSVNFSGYYPVIDSCQGLVFLPQPPLTAGWNAMGTGTDSDVRTIAVSGSDIYVGGTFNQAGGVNASKIARWDGSGWSSLGSGVNSWVLAVAVSGSDVYVGGLFTSAGGVANTNYIARWDGSSWHALGSGLTNQVHAITISGSDVYVGGTFTDAGSNPNADYIARWDGSSWYALGSGVSNTVRAIVVSGTIVYAGGAFTAAGGNSANYIARWNGSSWAALGSGMDNGVTSIAISGSDVYAGGLFQSAGGNTNAKYIARWNGNNWSSLGSGVNNIVNVLSVSGNDIFVGGEFGSAGGNSNARGIARWDGSSWSALGNGLNSGVFAVPVSGNYLYAGGFFSDAGGNTNADRIAYWEFAPLPVELLTFRAHAEEKQVLLDWRTASESNNLGWDIERSADGRQWQALGFRAGHGTTSEPQAYSFTDEQPLPDRNYYRLRQSDHDGKYEYSEVVQVVMSGIGEQTGAFYPNPARSGLVNLDYYAEKEGDLSVSVFDALGRLMILQNQPLQAERNVLQFDFSQLTPGTYSVLLDNGANRVYRTLTIQ